MWFWALEAQVSNIIGDIITVVLVVADVLFGALFIWCINMYQTIGEL